MRFYAMAECVLPAISFMLGVDNMPSTYMVNHVDFWSILRRTDIVGRQS